LLSKKIKDPKFQRFCHKAIHIPEVFRIHRINLVDLLVGHVGFDEGYALVCAALLDGELEGLVPDVLQVLGVSLSRVLLQ
jgi:hypothetical protein